MIRRLLIPFLVTATTLAATIAIWYVLEAHQAEQITRISEAESYAARSRLVRNIDTFLRALSNVQAYWSRFGRLPRGQWASDAGIEVDHFAGVELIAWDDPGHSIRYLYTSQHPAFDYRPTDEEWARYESLLSKAAGTTGEQMLGPFTGDAGNTYYEVCIAPSKPDEGTLIAVVDADEALGHLLKDDSPGYAITVTWDDVPLYRRGEPAPDLSPEWVRTGLIENRMGTLWEVRHSPTDALAESLRTPAVPAVLYAGIAISILLGMLVFETSRANRRAASALSAEHRLSEMNRALEQQVARRTRELEERSADIVTISDSVAHDLRNPLNSISTNAELLEQQFEDALGEDGLSILRQIHHCVGATTEILDRLLRLSVVSHFTFSRERLDMTELVSDAFDELSPTEPPPAVEFVLHDLPDANADPDLVPVLLFNLLSNALKYTRQKDRRRIEVGAETGGECTTYFVRDNGVGFDTESAGRLFRAFERLDEHDDTEGLGLGLDIAARIISRHGGLIRAEGERGRGATFYFTLGADSAVD